MENITNSDYNHAKKNCRDFKTKKIRWISSFPFKTDTLLLADVSKNF